MYKMFMGLPPRTPTDILVAIIGDLEKYFRYGTLDSNYKNLKRLGQEDGSVYYN